MRLFGAADGSDSWLRVLAIRRVPAAANQG
jgi:hypothetical protein